MRNRVFILAFLILVSVVVGAYGECFDCHGDKGIVKTFANGEKIDVYVDPKAYKSSSHGRLDCSSCHRGYVDGHEGKYYRSLSDFRRKMQVCLNCHGDKLASVGSHKSFVSEYKSGDPKCVNCHNPHYLKRQIGKNEASYCATCHLMSLQMVFKNGEKIQVKVDFEVLKKSVHKDIACSDCHIGFSRTRHPQRIYRSYKEFQISVTEGCRKCHFDKFAKATESIHAKLLSEGVESAPTCIDCHGGHNIVYISKYKDKQIETCGNCHSDTVEVYKKSVHGIAVIERKDNFAASCADCHTAHMVKDPKEFSFKMAIPDICGKCHGDPNVMKRYNLSTDVVKTYLSDFHGVTLKMYKEAKGEINIKPIGVCTDCHGYHDITKISGGDISLIKERLVKACAKCHPGATHNFPDAWIPHYEPSLKKAPLVFLVKAFYSVFIPFMILGLILNVLLHIWRYITGK